MWHVVFSSPSSPHPNLGDQEETLWMGEEPVVRSKEVDCAAVHMGVLSPGFSREKEFSTRLSDYLKLGWSLKYQKATSKEVKKKDWLERTWWERTCLLSFFLQSNRTSLCDNPDTHTKSISPQCNELKILQCKEPLRNDMTCCQTQAEGFHSN